MSSPYGMLSRKETEIFTPFSYFQKRNLDSSPTIMAAASPRRFGQSDANKNSPVSFCHTTSRGTKKKTLTICYSEIKVANRYSSLSEHVLLKKLPN